MGLNFLQPLSNLFYYGYLIFQGGAGNPQEEWWHRLLRDSDIYKEISALVTLTETQRAMEGPKKERVQEMGQEGFQRGPS